LFSFFPVINIQKLGKIGIYSKRVAKYKEIFFTIFILQNITKRGVCIMQSSLVQIRVEPTLKQKADTLFRSIGLDTATAVRLFFTQSLLKGTIPFEITANNHEVAPRKGWAEAFSKARKEQMLIPDTIDSDNFKWEW
jgi:DNA-damage-inducible protein J